jgi:hypothetical protein
VNSYTTDKQHQPTVAADAAGNFVGVEQRGTDGSPADFWPASTLGSLT